MNQKAIMTQGENIKESPEEADITYLYVNPTYKGNAPASALVSTGSSSVASWRLGGSVTPRLQCECPREATEKAACRAVCVSADTLLCWLAGQAAWTLGLGTVHIWRPRYLHLVLCSLCENKNIISFVKNKPPHMTGRRGINEGTALTHVPFNQRRYLDWKLETDGTSTQKPAGLLKKI